MSQNPEQPIVVVGPDGQPIGTVVQGGLDTDGDGEADATEHQERPLVDLVEQPAKVMRVGSMVKQLLEEVRSAPLDEASRRRLREIHERTIKELEDGLAPELVEELDRMTLPFGEDEVPSDAELRIAQAQLVGWLEGLFHGIQTTLFAQQMAARAQLEQMRRALPAGVGPPPGGLPPGMQPGHEQQPGRGASGPYL
ncbi:MAG: bacterial proteasome activator family protein [Candidatus Nanopelagicales bacterium]